MTRPAAPGRRASCPPAEQLLLEGTSSTADGTAVPTPGPDVGGGLAPAWALTGALSPRRAVRVAAVDASTGEVLHLFPGTALVSGPCPGVPWAVPLTERTRTGYAYRLLAFDLDAGRGDPAGDAVVLGGLLEQAGIGHLVAASGPTGGRHVWVGLAEGADPALVAAVARLARAVCPSLDVGALVNPATGCVRPPGAPHRAGGVSTVLAGDTAVLTAPSTSAAQLHALAELLAAAASAAPAGVAAGPRPGAGAREPGEGRVLLDAAGRAHLPGARRSLPPASQRALHSTLPAGADASAVLWRVLLGAAVARWRHGDVAEHLPAAPGLEHARTRSAGPGRARTARSVGEAGAVLARQWERAVAHVAAHPGAGGEDPTFAERAGALAELVEAVQARAGTVPGLWAARGGASRRRVLDAVCALQLRAVADEVDLDVRSLGLSCGIGREAARCALAWLAEHGWVRLVRPAEGARAATWALLPPAGLAAAAAAAASLEPPAPAPNPPAAFASGPAAPDPALITEPCAVPVHKGTDFRRSQVLPPPCLGLSTRSYWLARLDRRREARCHDAVTSAGLGLSAGELSSVISEAVSDGRAVTTRELLGPVGAAVGPLRVVRRVLERLVDHDLVRVSSTGPAGSNGWVPGPAASRDAAARALHVEGVLVEREARYTLERALYAWWQAELTWMTAPTRTGDARRPSPGQTALPVPDGAATGRAAGSTGPQPYPAHPRRKDGRADYRTARTHTTAASSPPTGAGQATPARSSRPGHPPRRPRAGLRAGVP